VGRRAALQLIVGVIALGAAGALLADVAGAWRFHDLWCFYHGGEAVLRGVDPYDAPAWLALTDDPSRVVGSRIVATPCPSAFAYPYWTALAFAPLALLPYDVAAGLWGTLLIAGILTGVAFAVRASGAPTLLVAAVTLGSLPLAQVLAFGQLTGVLLPLVGLSLVPPRARAGASAGLLALKPQLGALFAAALTVRALRRGDLRFVAGLAAVFGVLAVTSLALFPSWPLEWGREILTGRWELARLLPTAWGLSLLLFGNAIWGAVATTLLVVTVLLVARGRDVEHAALGAIVLAISLFATPHVAAYDQLFLVLPWAVVLAGARRRAPRDRRLLLAALVTVAVILPWALLVIQSRNDTLNAVVPALSAVLVTVAQPRRVRGGEVRTSAPPPLPV
jgi:hypothetical protein